MHEPAGKAVGFGPAFVEQMRWFWRRLWLWILIAPVFTSLAVGWMISSMEDEASPFAFLIVGNAMHPLLVLIALSWALSAWRDDPPKDRQYFWLHPVERTSHTIARSLAGFVYLMLVVAVIIAVVLIVTQVSHGADAVLGTPRFWMYVVGAIALAYIAASIAPVLSDRPGLWIILVVAVVIIAGAVAELRDIEWLRTVLSWFQGGSHSFGTALGAPGVEAARALMAEMPAGQAMEGPGMARVSEAEPTAALLLWLPISLAGYLAAAVLSRPR